jgi:hypothetical protein
VCAWLQRGSEAHHRVLGRPFFIPPAIGSGCDGRFDPRLQRRRQGRRVAAWLGACTRSKPTASCIPSLLPTPLPVQWGNWDEGLRTLPESISRRRDCICPELSRNRNIGATGVNMDAGWFEMSFQTLAWSQSVVGGQDAGLCAPPSRATTPSDVLSLPIIQ